MNAACSLICVDPARVHGFWPHAAPLIKAAMAKGRLTDHAEVAQRVRDGRALLWLGWDGNAIRAAAVTELSAANGERFCTIVACGAQRGDRSRWLPLLAGLENYARAEGCTTMRVFGRRGWLKLLPDYRAARVILEKPL